MPSKNLDSENNYLNCDMSVFYASIFLRLSSGEICSCLIRPVAQDQISSFSSLLQIKNWDKEKKCCLCIFRWYPFTVLMYHLLSFSSVHVFCLFKDFLCFRPLIEQTEDTKWDVQGLCPGNHFGHSATKHARVIARVSFLYIFIHLKCSSWISKGSDTKNYLYKNSKK